jgi:hypothetical protein
LLKRYVGRFQHHCSIRARTQVFGKGPVSPAKHFIARFELRYVLADRFNRPRIVDTHACRLWLAQTYLHCASDIGRASHDMPVQWINGSRANLDQKLVVIGNRLFNVLELEDIG